MTTYKDYKSNQTPQEKSSSDNAIKTEQLKKALEQSAIITQSTPSTSTYNENILSTIAKDAYNNTGSAISTITNPIVNAGETTISFIAGVGETIITSTASNLNVISGDVFTQNKIFDNEYKTTEEFVKGIGNNLSIDWQKKSPFDFLGLTDELQPVLDTLKSGVDTIKTFVDLVVAVVDFVANILILTANLVQAILLAFIKLLEAIRDLLQNTGMFFLNPSEKAFSDKSILNNLIKTNNESDNLFKVEDGILFNSYYTPVQTLRRIASSYDDTFDKNRPIGITTSDTHLIVMPYLLAPNIGNILLQFTKFLALLDKKQFQAIFDRLTTISSPAYIKELKDRQYPYYLFEEGIGIAPNWQSKMIREITGVKEVVDQLNKLIAMVKVASSAVELFKQAVRLFQQRLAQMQQIITNILNAIEDLIQLTTIPIGTLSMFGTGNIAKVQQSFLDALNHPSSPFTDRDEKGELVINSQANVSMLACVIHLQLGTGSSIEFLKALFSIRDSAIAVLSKHPSKDEQIQAKLDLLNKE